jgi:hypothetical protein
MGLPECATVEVAYALPERQHVRIVELTEGMTAMDAIESTGLLRECPELAGRRLEVGIFGRVVAADQLLRPGDRVEIYRRLKADPRATRRRLAASGRTMGKS